MLRISVMCVNTYYHKTVTAIELIDFVKRIHTPHISNVSNFFLKAMKHAFHRNFLYMDFKNSIIWLFNLYVMDIDRYYNLNQYNASNHRGFIYYTHIYLLCSLLILKSSYRLYTYSLYTCGNINSWSIEVIEYLNKRM